MEFLDIAQGVYTLRRVAGLVKEWDELAVAIQIDLKKAFNQVAHKAVTDVLVTKGVSTHLVAVLCKMWKQITITAKLNHVASREIARHRGVLQAAPCPFCCGLKSHFLFERPLGQSVPSVYTNLFVRLSLRSLHGHPITGPHHVQRTTNITSPPGLFCLLLRRTMALLTFLLLTLTQLAVGITMRLPPANQWMRSSRHFSVDGENRASHLHV